MIADIAIDCVDTQLVIAMSASECFFMECSFAGLSAFLQLYSLPLG